MSNALLTRLGNLYGPPKDVPNVKGFLDEYERAMGGYVDTELNLAADRLRDTRKYKTWPTVVECLEALKFARSSLRGRAIAAEAIARQQKPKLSEAEQRAAEKFVDDCAAGKIELGFCADLLRNLARQMQARRVRP